MKKQWILVIVFAMVLPVKYASGQQAGDILQQVEQNIRNMRMLSYHSSYTSINPTVEDSLYETSANVWLERVPADTIFGARFHVQGEDAHGTFDYFYDGLESYELRHSLKKISIFHPHDYPNNLNNPAKGRSALEPFIGLLIDTNFTKTILENSPTISVLQDDNRIHWVVTLHYPPNEYGQQMTKSLDINKSTCQIDRIDQKIRWQGSIFKTKITLKNYEQDVPSISEHLALTRPYASYSREVFTPDAGTPVNTYADLIGQPAPGFRFESFAGKQLSLNQFRGKFVLLDFWESWCGHCLFALPELNALQQSYGEDTLKVIGLVTENKRQIAELISQNNLMYSNLLADQSILTDYRVTGRPVYFLIDPKGHIAAASSGNLEKIKSRMAELIR